VRKLLAVAARELRERWLLFPASFVFGFNPLVLPAFGVDRQVMPEVGLMTSIGFGAAAAVLMGSTMLARDASNGRLGFLFSRPVSWPAIWGGKWLAALVLVVSSGLLAAIPWMTAFPLASIGGHHGDSWIRAMLDGPGSAFVLVLFVLVVGLVNFGATAFRSRSPWFALDLVLLLAAFWATRRYVAPLLLYGVVTKEQVPPVVLLLPLALALLLGSVAQVAVGRTDPRRAHGAMSLAFWAVVGLTLTMAAGCWLWARSATPAEVSVSAVTRDPAGRWIYVEGAGQHSGRYPHRFLIDTTTARHLAHPGLDEELRFAFGMLFSADGRFGVLPGTAKDGASLELFDLREATPRVTQVTLESSPPPSWRTTFALSPSATSVFVVHESGASLFELPSGRRMATTTIQPGWRPAAARYLAEGAARAWLVPSDEGISALRAQAEMRVVDLATDGAASGTTFPLVAAIAPGSGWRSVLPDADGQRLLTSDAGLHLRDAATGELIASLVEGSGAIPALFLADGRVVVEDRSGAGQPPSGHARLWVFDRAGMKLTEIELPLPPWGLGIGPEVAPGRVVVSCLRSPFLSEDTLVVDVASGGVVDKLPGLRPATGFWGVSSAVPAGGAVSSVQYFRDAEGRVIRVDFASGERKVVAGTGAVAGERISAR
jgi:hypothetical protein